MEKQKSDLLEIVFFIVVIALLLFIHRPVADTAVLFTPNKTLPWPLPHGEERTKLLTFGLYVTPNPDNNPIDPPERFTGYHTALDIEIFPEEIDKVVPVSTICGGDIVYAGTAEGYGGVIIQACRIQGQEVRVLYGHLDSNSFQVSNESKNVPTETIIAQLGKQNSAESGYNRKHLHLGIHKGTKLEFLGYVQNQKDLDQFIDPLPLFSH